MSSNRRDFFTKLSSLSAGIFAGRGLLSAQQPKNSQGGMDQMEHMQQPSPKQPSKQVRVGSGVNTSGVATGPLLVTTPDIADLPFTMENGVKVFHVIAEPVKQVIVPGRTFDLWGFNGSAPGPTIQASERRMRVIEFVSSSTTTCLSLRVSTGTVLNFLMRWMAYQGSVKNR